MSRKLHVLYGRKLMSAQMLECLYFRSRNGDPSQKGCVVNVKQLRQEKNEYLPPPPPPSTSSLRRNQPHKLLFAGCSSSFMRLAKHLNALRARCARYLPGRRKSDAICLDIVTIREPMFIRLRQCLKRVQHPPLPPTPPPQNSSTPVGWEGLEQRSKVPTQPQHPLPVPNLPDSSPLPPSRSARRPPAPPPPTLVTPQHPTSRNVPRRGRRG